MNVVPDELGVYNEALGDAGVFFWDVALPINLVLGSLASGMGSKIQCTV